MGMQNFIEIFQKVQEIGPVYQNLDLGKASADDKWHLKSHRLDLLNISDFEKKLPTNLTRFQNLC